MWLFLRAHLKRLFFLFTGGLVVFILGWFGLSTVKATSTTAVLWFPLATYQVPFQDYYYDATTNPDGHKGLDYANAEGTPVYAPISGTVIAAENTSESQVCSGGVGYNGNYVTIQDDTGVYKVSILHMQTGSVQFQTGEYVTAGDYIGNMSNTGYTWGAENASRGDLDGNGTIEGYVCGYGYGIHIHVQLYEKVEGSYVIVNPSGYWMTDDDGIPVKAETGSTSATPSTATSCDVPDATTTFFIQDTTNT